MTKTASQIQREFEAIANQDADVMQAMTKPGLTSQEWLALADRHETLQRAAVANRRQMVDAVLRENLER